MLLVMRVDSKLIHRRRYNYLPEVCIPAFRHYLDIRQY